MKKSNQLIITTTLALALCVNTGLSASAAANNLSRSKVEITVQQLPPSEAKPTNLHTMRNEATTYRRTPQEILRNAETITIQSKSAYLKASLLEAKLLGREDFRELGLTITTVYNDSDLVIEVQRALFTNVFIYSIIDRQSGALVASGKCNSFFGTASGKIAKKVTKQLKNARSSNTKKKN